MGNTAVEIAAELANHRLQASPPSAVATNGKVYLSHRRGACLISRYRAGPPPELTANWQNLRVVRWLEENYTRAYGWVVDLVTFANMKSSWELDPAWGLSPPPSAMTVVPCQCEDLVPLLAQNKIASVRGIKRFVGPRSIELLNGTVLDDVDAVIMATGYDADLTVTPWLRHVIPKTPYAGRGQPELYLQMIPPQYADSFFCLNVFNTLDTIWVLGELASMAIAQIWSGRESFPSQEVMRQSILKQVEYNAYLWRVDPSIEKGIVKPVEWWKFVHEKAGTGMVGALGWGWEGWRFWWKERELSQLMGWGIISPFNNRLLETGKRKTWAKAREELKKANAEARGLDAPVRKLTLEEARTIKL
jgi:dimethylaniline monooxygenase (N-oxide forming)